VHQAERQRAVGSRQQRDVLVTFLGGRRAARIDGDQARTAPPRFLSQAPEVKVGDDAVGSPDGSSSGQRTESRCMSLDLLKQ
jgi:hypothetical protein